MAITFIQQKRRQQYLIGAFVFLLIAIGIYWLIFYGEMEFTPELSITEPKQIKINLEVLENPAFQNLLPFEEMQVYQEAKNVSLSPVFSWQGVEGAENYIFEIIGFVSSEISSTSINLSDVNKELQPSTTYTWRVKACNEDYTGCGIWSNNCNTGLEYSCSRFTTIEKPVFSLVSPFNKAKNVSLSPVFSWQGVEGAENYIFEIISSESETIFSSQISSTSINLSDVNKELQPSTTYTWRVKACNEDYTGCGIWSSRSFTTAALFVAPEIIEPSAEEEIILGRDNPFFPY